MLSRSSGNRVLTRSLVRPRQLGNTPAHIRRAQISVSSISKIPSRFRLYRNIAGGIFTLAAGYGWYRSSGVKQGVDAAVNAKPYLDQAKLQLEGEGENLDAKQTVEWLRSKMPTYVKFIPGVKGLLDKIFNQLENLGKENEDEMMDIMNEARKDLHKLVMEGSLDLSAVSKAGDILKRASDRLEQLSHNVKDDLVEMYPELKKFGPQLRQLRDMSEQFGDDTKKQYQETYDRLKAALKDNPSEINAIVEDGFRKAQSAGDEALDKLLKKAKPHLDKSPELKSLIDDNFRELRKKDASGLLGKLQEAIDSGNASALKGYIAQQMNKLHGMSNEVLTAAMAEAGIDPDKYPELQKKIKSKAASLGKIDLDSLMDRLQTMKDNGDVKPVEDLIEEESQKSKKS